MNRLEFEKREDQFLKPYALRSSLSKGREYPEEEHHFRTCFQRDRDRIVHSTAFRRLEYKTQVFVNHEGDHYRTRLTHTLEVAQIGRSMARILALNEDAVEAICLAHDLGHGPFGHAGEHALARIMKDYGGFEHNRQSIRIVTKLENNYPNFQGLNLTCEVLSGLGKHDARNFAGEKRKYPIFLEAQLADLADSIAYNAHDLDDGLTSGLIRPEDLAEIKIWQYVNEYVERHYANIRARQKEQMAIRLLINLQIEDLMENTFSLIEKSGVTSHQDLENQKKPLISFTDKMEVMQKECRAFLYEKFYRHYKIVRMTEKGVRMIEEMFRVFVNCPDLLPSGVRERVGAEGLERAVCDYITGMTDRYAQDEYQRLFFPFERV